MRTRSSLERLAAAGRPLLAEADSDVDPAEEERIFAGIVATDRAAVPRKRPVALALTSVAAVAVIGAALVAVMTHGRAAPIARSGGHGHHRVALTGARIQMAGYHFRTPAGFKASGDSCLVPVDTSSPGQPSTQPPTVMNGFAAAASAEGGCVEAFFEIPGSPGAPPIPTDAESVAIGSYQGYFSDQAEGNTLWVKLPDQVDGRGRPIFLVLYGQGLTRDQLIAVAASGLPTLPLSPTTTTGTEAGG